MAGIAWPAARSAVHARLWTDATLKSLLGPHPDDETKAKVFSGEPAKLPQAPFVIIDEAIEDPNNRMGGKVGKSITLTIHAWSKQATDAESDQVGDRVDELLDNNLALVVAGYDVELLNNIGVQYLTDSPRGGTWTPLRHGILRYQLDVKEAAS